MRKQKDAPRQLARQSARRCQPARDLGPAEDFIDQERGRFAFLQLQTASIENEAIAELQALA